MNTNLLNILKHIQKVKHQVLFFYSRCVFCNYTLSFYNCILYSHSPDNLGQPTQMIKSAKIVHVLNFKTTTYLIIKQLQRVYENQSIVFPEWKRSAKARVLRGSRQKYRNTFYCDNDQIVMLKSEALKEDDLNSVKFTTN